MANVYFKPVSEKASSEELSNAAKALLEHIIQAENCKLSPKIPLKVHFGEKGNRTFLPAAVYDGVIDALQARNVECRFIETSVLYGGERFCREKHTALALQHGFTRIPVTIADGERGEESVQIPIENGKHFKSCAVAREIAEAPQLIVLSHFKGHALAGFGGAIKQLSMGCASKGGKMAMHLSIKPRIINFLCKKCKLCTKRCNENAITIGKRSFIDHDKCIGCGACFSACPHHAVSIFSLQGFWNALFKGKFFREKLVEYALAAQKGKPNIYITFAANVTRGCDCEPRPMAPCVPDIGVFASTDPVAIDAACFEAVMERGKVFKGREQLNYAEELKLGSCAYTLVEPDLK